MALSKIDPAGLDIGQIGGRRNLIINGSAIVDQRNNGAARTTDGYVADRWFLQAVSEDQLVFSADQDTTTPDNFSKSLRIQVTTAETSVDANDLFRWIHKIEAQDLQMLNYGSSAAQSFTLSFYVRSSLTGTYALNFYTPDSDRNITKTYTINAADTWERKTVTVEGDTAGSGITDDNGEGLQINWILMAGSDYTSVDSTSWGTNADNRRAYNHTAEFGTSTSHTFYLTGVQLEVGSVATPFEHRSFGEEYLACARYYYQVTGEGSGGFLSVGPAQRWSDAARGVCQTLLPVPLRTKPTISIGTNVFADYGGTSTTLTGTSTIWAAANNATSVWWKYTHSSSSVGAGIGGLVYTNDASASFVKFDAEL